MVVRSHMGCDLILTDSIADRHLCARPIRAVKNEQDALNLLHGMEYKYQTPLGGALSCVPLSA
jgi:hypothetical protein